MNMPEINLYGEKIQYKEASRGFFINPNIFYNSSSKFSVSKLMDTKKLEKNYMQKIRSLREDILYSSFCELSVSKLVDISKEFEKSYFIEKMTSLKEDTQRQIDKKEIKCGIGHQRLSKIKVEQNMEGLENLVSFIGDINSSLN